METVPTEKTKKAVSNIWWIIILGIVLLLFSTNPSESQFKEFLKEDFKKQAKEAGLGIFGGPLAGLAGLTSSRNDYLLFSTFEISILGDKYEYLGILNHFSQIN